MTDTPIPTCPFCNIEMGYTAVDDGFMLIPFPDKHRDGCFFEGADFLIFDTLYQALAAWSQRSLPWREFDKDDEATWPKEGAQILTYGYSTFEIHIFGVYALYDGSHWLPASDLPLPRKE